MSLGNEKLLRIFRISGQKQEKIEIAWLLVQTGTAVYGCSE
jgi:hypothetical protein